MTGCHTTDPGATPFALEVMEYMNKACNRWKEETNIGFSIYGSPIESTTYKFAKCLQKRFGIIEGITDRSYITNSYHVNVSEEIDRVFQAEIRGPSSRRFPQAAPSAMWRSPTCSTTFPPCFS